MTSVKLKWLVSSANAGEVIDKSNWGDGEELLYTCARKILRSDFQGFPRWKRATADDLLLTRNGTPYIHIPAEGAIYSNVVQRISVPKVDKFFLRYALEDRVRSFRGYGVSIESLNYEMWSNLEVPLPDLPTQRRIAGFLDRETARIDQLIEKKQRLTALLGERNNVARSEHLKRLRDHHGGRKLSHICLIQRGRFNYRPRNAEELYDGEFPFLQTGDVAQAKKFITDYKQTLSGLGASISKKFKKGTVLIAIAANVGDVAILDLDAFCPDSVVGFLAERKVDTEFLYYVLKGAGEEIATSSTSNAQDNTNIARLSALKVPMPPKEEQVGVAAQFARQEEQEIRLSEQTTASIDRLREYRSALITAAVTGQIDVQTCAQSGTPDAPPDAIQAERGA